MPSGLTVPAFVVRWQGSSLSERSAAQSHFIDLCDVLAEPHPAAADPLGESYTFEKGVSKTSGGPGFADVWKKSYFAWEYKKRHKGLTDAYRQLLNYREDLDNPPLLVVCDLDRFEVHTNFTNTTKKIYSFALADMLTPEPLPGSTMSAFDVLRAVFTDPIRLRPAHTRAEVTEAAAAQFARLAESLRSCGVPSDVSAHFLMRLLFCLFAEDVDLLPPASLTHIVESTVHRPGDFPRVLRLLFAAMATGGYFGADAILHFNGGLFADDTALDLSATDLQILARATKLDWADVEPAIFGTLFERSLDPDKRSQLGAHYTSRGDILLIVEPVLMEPLRREWVMVKQQAHDVIVKRDTATGRTRTRHQQVLERLLTGFAGRIAGVRILDPACGSGNFLYVALRSRQRII